MATELELQAYIFLGNALNLAVNGVGATERTEFETTPQALAALYARVEPLTPNTITPGVDTLSPEERDLLLRICLWCVRRFRDVLAGVAGVSEAEAHGVIAWLERRAGGE